MERYVGLDVSVKETSICVMNYDGSVAVEGEVASNPDAIAAFITEHAANAKRLVHESEILAIWLTRELDRRGCNPLIAKTVSSVAAEPGFRWVSQKWGARPLWAGHRQ